MKRGVVLAGAVIAVAMVRPARGDRPVIVPADDVRTQAQVARRWLALSTWYERIDGVADTNLVWFQVGIGPFRQQLPLRGATLGPLARWSMRLRFGRMIPDETADAWLPLTIAAQRISIYDTLSILPLVHLQGGLEVAASTPWLFDRKHASGETLPIVHGPDAELADSGWSLRPATWHARADVLACRSLYLEGAIGPEWFRSTTDDAYTNVNLRWRFAAGISFGCTHEAGRINNDLTLAAQYRARGVLYDSRAAVAPSYHDTVSLLLQYDRGRTAYALFATVEAGEQIDDATMVGLRVTRGIGAIGP